MVRNEWFAFLLGPAVLQIEFLNVESFLASLYGRVLLFFTFSRTVMDM